MSTDYSQQVAEILDALGDSPTPDQAYHATRNYDERYIAAALAASVAAAGGGGGSQPEALRVLDLGLVDITDTNDGPVTLYTPAAGDLVLLTFSAVGFLMHDIDDGSGALLGGQNVKFADPQNCAFILDTDFDFALIEDVIRGTVRVPTVAGTLLNKSIAGSFMPTGDPIVFQAFTQFDVAIPAVKPLWQQNHAYDGTVNDIFIRLSGGGWLTLDTGTSGTSGAVEPVWPGPSNSVVDNDITWFSVVPATVGTIHMYAIVSTPATP